MLELVSFQDHIAFMGIFMFRMFNVFSGYDVQRSKAVELYFSNIYSINNDENT